MGRPFRVAAAQYDIGFPADWGSYAAKIRRRVDAAAGEGAALLVFPEYFSMELAALFGEGVYSDLRRQLDAMQDVLPDFLALFAGEAERRGVHVLAGSFPVRVAGGRYRNRAFLLRPDGTREFQDKLQMTRFEAEQWGISGGDEIRVFDTALGRLGVSVCYDAEFPMIARRQVEAGADVVLVPSCTDTRAGYWRVRIGCQARALENQCYVVQAPTVGEARWSPAVDVNAGAAGVFTPVDRGFPDDGVLALGDADRPLWVFADIDPAEIATVRRTGQVFNDRDWPTQFRWEAARPG